MQNKNVYDYIPEEVDGKNGKTKLSDIKNSPLIGVYFSAHWCPPCKAFTPLLSKFYKLANEKEKQIEIIFISFDRDEKSYKEYYDSMPWLSFPFKSEKKEVFAKDFSIKGIPALLIFDKDGKLIDYDGRMSVQNNFKGDSGNDVVSGIIKNWHK
jgi:nucleoredoxin